MDSSPPPAEPNAGASLHVRLYFAGGAPNSVSALDNLKAVLAQQVQLVVDLELIDVLKDPDRALHDGIFVTPMLIRLEPLPERRILGSLRDRKLLLDVLGGDATG